MNRQWREIFRAGDYGGKGTYTRDDLDSMVANFNAQDQVPIVVGHPQTNSPAWGWLSGLRRVGDILQGREAEVHPSFAKARDQRLFKNRSVRIAKTPAGPKLLHLGYLGAALPEVEGLSGVVFTATPETETIDFALVHVPGGEEQTQDNIIHEGDKKTMDDKQRIEQLEADLAAEKQARADEAKERLQAEAARRREDFARFVQSEMVEKGKLAKERKEEAVSFLCSLPANESADFSWGDGDARKTSTSAVWFMDFIRALPEPQFLRELPAGADFALDEGQGRRVDLTTKV